MNTFEDMQALLASSLNDVGNTVAKIKKNTYSELIQHSNIRTYSTTELFHACPRKFAKEKFDAHFRLTERSSTPTFAFGHAVGAGVAVFDATGDRRKALFAAFKAWDVDFFAEERKVTNKGGESLVEALWAIYAYEVFYNEEGIDQYEVINIEATLAVDLEDGYYYSGHVDELARHKVTGRYIVFENKTDGGATIDPAKYSNSDQALSYSIVVDMLGASEYNVVYRVYSKMEHQWHKFEFVKTANAKAEWVQDQLLVDQQLEAYAELDFFPKRGSSCRAYNRRCKYYENCELSFQAVYRKRFDELPRINSIDDIDALEHVNYRTSLSEIVARQQEKLNGKQ